MDVRINNLSSNLHMSDARAMLQPEVLEEIVRAVMAQMERHGQEQQRRQHDMAVRRQAVQLDTTK